MSLSLSALPPEILGCVVANLASQPTSLCNLARCSRQIYLCTVPHLYRHVTIQEEVRKGEQQDGLLKNLASLLIRRQDLAGLVRYFTLHDALASMTEVEYWEERKSIGDVSPEMVEVDQAFTLSKEEKIKWLGQCSHTHRSYHDLILALLLPALLKVEKLVMDFKTGSCASIGHNPDVYYLEQMIQRASRTEKPFDIQQPFQALTVFVLLHNPFNVGTTGLIAALLKLPAIQEISGGFMSTWNWDRDDFGHFGDADNNPIELDSSSSPLTSLDLADYRLSAADLRHMLRAPKALNTLRYWVWMPASVKFTDLRHALGPQENSLERLGLDYCVENSCRNSNLEPMASFISFNSLKVFKTAAAFLITTENGTGRHRLINIFPPNLETLHLTRFQDQARFESLLEALEHLLAQKSPQQIPSLKKIILEEGRLNPFFDARFGLGPTRLIDVLWKDTHETVMERLRRVAAGQGVSIDVIKPPDDEDSSEEDSSNEDSSNEESPVPLGRMGRVMRL